MVLLTKKDVILRKKETIMLIYLRPRKYNLIYIKEIYEA